MDSNPEPRSGNAADLVALHCLERVGEGHFVSPFNDTNVNGEIFGGQYLGQSLAAAMQVATGYVPQMLAGFFLRPARANRPLQFLVEETRSGRRFAHRKVTALQDGREVFRAEVGLCIRVADQPEHQNAMPDVPGPVGLKSLRELASEHADKIGPAAVRRLTGKAGFDTYPVDPSIGFGAAAAEPVGRYWLRSGVAGAQEAAIDYAVLAYMSDAMANMPSRAMYAPVAYDDTLSAVSLNHCIWFHDRPDAAGWFLFDHESCFASGGIGSNRGLIYAEDGRLVASIAQDALVQYRE